MTIPPENNQIEPDGDFTPEFGPKINDSRGRTSTTRTSVAIGRSPANFVRIPARMARYATHTVSILLLLIGACGGDRESPRVPPTDAIRRSTAPHEPKTGENPDLEEGVLRAILTRDINGDGSPERVLVALDSTETHPADAIADRVVVMTRIDGSTTWTVAAIDSSRWTISVECRDVTGDHLPDLVLTRSAGGNDPVASVGLAVISSDGSDDRRIRTVLSLRHGDPIVVDSSEDEATVVVRARLWPPQVPRTESFEYMDDILRFSRGIFRSDLGLRQSRFRSLLRNAMTEYRSIRPLHRGDTSRYADSLEVEWSSEPRTSPLFPPAARVLLYALKSGDVEGGDLFWRREQEYLRKRLPRGQFELLDSMWQRALAGGDHISEGME